eukprot:SAG31_NODE_3223_length_4523_cov_2.474910_5_plen_165_part_00
MQVATPACAPRAAGSRAYGSPRCGKTGETHRQQLAPHRSSRQLIAALRCRPQGCTIGCETCTGIGSHSKVSLCADPKNGTQLTDAPSVRAASATRMPKYLEKSRKNLGTAHLLLLPAFAGPGGKHTLPKYAWTMNRNVVPDSPQDSYKFNPWRAPGAAPGTTTP